MSGVQFILFSLGCAVLFCFIGYALDRCVKPISRLLTKWGF